MYVLKRPHMDTFMASVGAAYEVVVFTASLAKYADPLLDLLDKGHVVRPPAPVLPRPPATRPTILELQRCEPIIITGEGLRQRAL